ncbi:MAG: hypothetical protein NXI31_24315 [bacterium]|nr:hypothetical protein [bacterium]
MSVSPSRLTLPALAIGLIFAGCQSPTARNSGAAGPSEAHIPGSMTGGAWSCTARVELSSLWRFLHQKYDEDGDGRVTTAEYDRGETRFSNYDRNSDGILTAADFPADTYFNGFNHFLMRFADGNEDGDVTRAEWDELGNRLDADGDGQVTQTETQNVLGDWAEDWPLFLLSFDQDHDADFDRRDLDLAFRDQDFDGNGTLTGKETRGWSPTAEPDAPALAVGQAAPDFELPFVDDIHATLRLTDARSDRPVALVFGSYT